MESINNCLLFFSHNDFFLCHFLFCESGFNFCGGFRPRGLNAVSWRVLLCGHRRPVCGHFRGVRLVIVLFCRMGAGFCDGGVGGLLFSADMNTFVSPAELT